MFENIKAAPADPILGLGEAFKLKLAKIKKLTWVLAFIKMRRHNPDYACSERSRKRLFDKEKRKLSDYRWYC